jgi:hypothetical protein
MNASDFVDPNRTIHIPARDLAGSREAKLAELDTLMAQLQVVRLVLCGQQIHVGCVDTAVQCPPHSGLWARAASRLRDLRGAFAQSAADTRSDRS